MGKYNWGKKICCLLKKEDFKMVIGTTGTINYAPDAIYQFEREIDGASANIKTPLLLWKCSQNTFPLI